MRIALILLLLILISCENIDVQNRTINAQGFESEKKLTLTKSNIELDSIVFADGEKRYQLNGEFFLNDTIINYSILCQGRLNTLEAINQTLPFSDDNSDDFRCKIKSEKNACELFWWNGDKRLYIRDKLIEVH